MPISIKAKEAIKVSLAFVLVYFIALQLGWMNPYWAGFAVAMIALPTAGQSIHKGMLRLWGTIPGCIAALVILALAPQDRWAFMLLASAWIFFTTYMMLIDKDRSYFWNVAGFVCLVITLSGQGGSSESMFQHAMFRSLETAMGVIVYTLVTVFLWPQSNAGAIKKASSQLIATQAARFRVGVELASGSGTGDKLQELHAKEVQQLTQLGAALLAEGSESYQVQELRGLWKQYQGLSAIMMETLDRLQNGQENFPGIDLGAVFPDRQAFVDELDRRFEAIRRMLAEGPMECEAVAVSLSIDYSALHTVSHLDRAALAVVKKELENIEQLTREMLDCARELVDDAVHKRKPRLVSSTITKNQGTRLPVIDPDQLRGATFAALCVVIGFLVWIYANPPGHAGWFQMAGAIGMAVAGMQQARLIILVKPFAVAMALGLGAYVFIMPQLSSFAELGLLLFLAMFVASYFFTGLARLAGMVSVINMISVQNQQTYNFAAMANSYVYTLLIFIFIFAMSYMLRSARPEKVMLNMLRRFFRAAEFLVGRVAQPPGSRNSLLENWKTTFYRYELRTLPDKLAAWGRAIDHKLFPNTTPEQVQTLVTSLQSLGYRLEQMLDADGARQADTLVGEMREDMQTWGGKLESAFAGLSEAQDVESAPDINERLSTWLSHLEACMGETLERLDPGSLRDGEAENFYRLLGSVRGVSEATVAYTCVADSIDWAQWREEVFS